MLTAPLTQTLYIPPINFKNNTELDSQRGIIRDVIIGTSVDQCTEEAFTRLRLIIDHAHGPSFVAILDAKNIKALKKAFGDKVSRWFGQEVLVCRNTNHLGRNRISVYPISS